MAFGACEQHALIFFASRTRSCMKRNEIRGGVRYDGCTVIRGFYYRSCDWRTNNKTWRYDNQPTVRQN